MKSFFFPFLLFFQTLLSAQQPHHHMMMHDTAGHPMAQAMQPDSGLMRMPSAFSKNLPMAVNGSGTSWQPANSPLYMKMWQHGDWHFMLHRGLFLRYSAQNINRKTGQRGANAFDAPNWIMLMATHPVGRNGQLLLRGMFSADLWTVGGAGYPLLLQTGESWKGRRLIDRQHPHDLISELSIGYTQALNRHTDVYAYFGLPGEPSIGPPAFMHRPSALEMPSAPLSHHWQDATHITFGVATLGLRYGPVKIESSSFTGREPDEKRYNFDRPRFDSYSARLSVNPADALAFQTSYAWIKSPEALEPDQDVERITASILGSSYPEGDEVLSASLVWGLNRYHRLAAPVLSSYSVLLEADWQLPHYAWFTRLEWVQKDNEELALSDGVEGIHNHNVSAFSLGASRYLLKGQHFWLDLGLTGSAYALPRELDIYYGSSPYSLEVFLRIVPPRIKMGSMGGMKHKM